MFIQTEQTPNPKTLKFLPGKVVMSEGTAFFQNITESHNSPLAEKLFEVEGVEGVFLGSDFITITKNNSLDWQIMKPLVLTVITDHFNSGDKTILNISDDKRKESQEDNPEDSNIVKQIKELLYTRVRPAVAMDGGDIVYESYKDGIVYLHMQGACSGCPSSTATLKVGIENMLKHYLPEIKEVRPVDV